MTSVNRYRSSFAIAVALCVVLSPTSLWASIWNNVAGGSWATPGNWDSLPNAIDAIADFSTLNITANATVTLDNSAGFTVGSLLFGDTTPSNNWTISPGTPAGTITLAVSSGSPTINVVNQTATISAILAGTQGLTKTGSGTLTLSGANTYSGGLTVNNGFVRTGNAAAMGTGAATVNSGGTLIVVSGTPTNSITLAGGTLGLARTSP